MWAPTLRRGHAQLAHAARSFSHSTHALAAAGAGSGPHGPAGGSKASSSSGSVGGADRHPDAPVYSRNTSSPVGPSPSGGGRRGMGGAQTSAESAAMMREAAAMAADASAREAQAAARRLQQPQRHSPADSSSHPDSAPPLSDAELRAQMGMADVGAANFRFRRLEPRMRRVLRLLALLAVPVLAYHLFSDVRRFVDEQIEWLTKKYEDKYGKPKPKRDFFAPPPAAVAAATPAATPAPAAPTPAKPAALASAPAKVEAKKAAAPVAPVAAAKAPVKEEAKKAESKLEPAAAAAAAAAVAAAPAAPKAAAPVVRIPSAEEQQAAAAELAKLLQLREELKKLAQLERLALTTVRPVDARIKALADALNIGTEPLPAMRAIRELQQVYGATELTPPTLPAPPRWSAAPADAEEARDRLQQIAEFRQQYELAVAKHTVTLQRLLATELGSRIDRAFDAASAEFDEQLPLRLKAAELATRSALEGGEMVELATLSRDVISSKSAEWSRINAEELAQQRADLEKATEAVLAKQEHSLRAQFEPEVRTRLAALAAQKKQIAALQRDLAQSAAIEETGARVHLLTNILLTLEEALRLDEHKQALFVSPPSSLPSQQVPAQKTGADLQHEWARLLEASRGDARLHALAASVPLDALGQSSPIAVQSLTTLRKSFNQSVEPVVRAATFLPPTEDADRSLPAFIYSRLLGALTFKEGHALRRPQGPHDDAARLNNAAYYLNRERNLAAAVAELDALSERPRAEAEQWITQAKQRVEVERVFGQVRRHVEDTAQTYIAKGKF